MKRPLLVFSPLPPMRSGIADSCLAQLPYLAQDRQVTVVVSNGNSRRVDRRDPQLRGIAVISESAWAAHAGDFADSAALFHLGNSPDCDHVLRACQQASGVAMLHDYTLHHRRFSTTAGRGDWGGYERLLTQEHGAAAGDMVTAARRFDPGFAQFVDPLQRDLLRRMRGVLVYSLWAKWRLRGAGIAPVHRLHHPFLPLPQAVQSLTRAEARSRLGLPADAFVVASLGLVTPAKQVDLALRALGNVRAALGDFRYAIVGNVPDRAELTAHTRLHGLEGHVVTPGYVRAEDLHTYIVASDAIVILRYPYAGESSGMLIRALGAGRPVIAFNYGAFAGYPDDAVCKIPLDTEQTGALEQALLVLRDRALAERMGAAGRRYAESEARMERVMGEMEDFMDRVYPE